MLGGLEKKNALVMEVLEHGGLIVAGGEEQLSLDNAWRNTWNCQNQAEYRESFHTSVISVRFNMHFLPS